MRWLLTEQEHRDLIKAVANGVQREDGFIEVEFPLHASSPKGERPALIFSSGSRTVHCGKRSARLSPKQFSLLQYVHEHGKASFEDVQDAVWGDETSDDAIRRVCSKLNTRLMDSGISYELFTYHGRISLEAIE